MKVAFDHGVTIIVLEEIPNDLTNLELRIVDSKKEHNHDIVIAVMSCIINQVVIIDVPSVEEVHLLEDLVQADLTELVN